jgi:hypothetical protein
MVVAVVAVGGIDATDSLAIDSIIAEPDKFLVKVNVIEPELGSDWAPVAMMISPYHFVKMSRRNLPLRFDWTQQESTSGPE